MKTGLFVAAMVQLASAQPHQNRHAHMHDKRDVVTQVQVVTATAPDAVVYVNQQGVPYSTSFKTEAAPQATPHTVIAHAAPAPAPVAAAAPAHAHHGGHHGHHGKGKGKSHAVTPDTVNVESTGNGGSNGSGHGSGNGKTGLAALQSNTGIVYSPYNADNSCKSASQVQSDLSQLGAYDYVRLYGVDCDQVANVAPVAKSMGMRLFLGLYDLDSVTSDVGTMAQGLGHNWSLVDAVSVGNELVNSGQASVGDVVAAIGTARGALKSQGYNGPVATVDTFIALENNPELCQASDFAGANAHAYFDGTIPASGAGQWAKQTQQTVAKACGKPCIITESGWPHQGMANGVAVPSPANQAAAISSLKSSFSSGGIILFTAFDDLWKIASPDTFDAEQYWGILSGQ